MAHLLLLTVLLAAAREPKEKTDGIVSRVASRATERVVDVVDPDIIINRVDVNALMGKVDIDALLARVDVNALLDQVDVNAIIDRVDVQRLMERVDIDAIVADVDVRDIAIRAGIPEIVRESTGELAGSALDVFRRQIVALDKIVSRSFYRVIGRDPDTRPVAPHSLANDEAVGRKGRGVVTGHYAGPLTRLSAFVIDAALVWASFVLTAAGVQFAIGLFSAVTVGDRSGALGIWGAAILLSWAFIYFALSLALAGRTLGMGLIGLRVVTRDGEPITGRQSVVRILVFPFSFLILGLGFLGLFTSPERRAMHDAAAGSVVVYDWGDRPAEIPAPLMQWAARKESQDPDLPVIESD